MSGQDLPAFADVVAAYDRIRAWVVRTPVVSSAALNEKLGRRVFFKCENLQTGGAFKYRGALNAILPLPATGITSVATHSSGNHGNAVALAARASGLQAHIVIPRDTARPKIANIRNSGGQITFCEPGHPAREAALRELLERISAEVVHPFEDARVIAGQGTATLELLTEVPALDVICTPIGGGGLIGGTALAASGMAPQCQIVGAEPAGADDAFRSFQSGKRQKATAPETLADGLRGSIGGMNFELLMRYVRDVVTVDEAQIVAAMKWTLQELKLLIEPSSAVPVAALLAGRVGQPGQSIGIILSGGNVDLEQCPFLSGAVAGKRGS
jgi:threonine dehydratase